MRSRLFLPAFFLASLAVLAAAVCKNKAEAPSAPVLESRGGGSVISGTLTVDPKLAWKISPSDVLFIIAKRTDGAGGPPVAVARYSDLKFPFKYSLSQDNVMMAGGTFEGKLNVSARVSKSGEAMGQMGDLSGVYPGNPVSVGESGIDFAINAVN